MTMQEVEEVDALLMETQEEAHEEELDYMEEETQLEADDGELLILGSILHTQDTPYDKAQRDMIFHSRVPYKTRFAIWSSIEEVALM